MVETRRVVLVDGSVLDLIVTQHGARCVVSAAGVVGFATADDVDEAVVRFAAALRPAVREILAPGEPTRAELVAQLAAVTRERDVLRAQQAPLVACVDALRAAARDAGWRDADATGETLVAWVRRGEREACDAALEDEERQHRAAERNVKATLEERAAAWERGAAIESVRAAIRALPLDGDGGAR